MKIRLVAFITIDDGQRPPLQHALIPVVFTLDSTGIKMVAPAARLAKLRLVAYSKSA